MGLIEKWSVRKIARQLRVGRRTVKKYLSSASPRCARRKRASKLDPFKQQISEILEQDPFVSGAVIEQRIKSQGYTGGKTILGDYLKGAREKKRSARAFVRVEVEPGERFEVDWGHFGVIDYEDERRKLYGFCMIDAHSRKLFVEFTHSQNLECFVRCHQHGFRFFGGLSREIAYDNLATAVSEHEGNIVQFNKRFLAFAREYGFYPRACHVASPWEKGKIERAGVGYVKQNFIPLRTFVSLHDANLQVLQWLNETANKRKHRETRQSPDERFRPDALRPLPEVETDYRETRLALVHKDLRLHFDGNRYCVPARYVGGRLSVKADNSSVTIYDNCKEIVVYARSWRRGQTFGAERFEKELLESRAGARHSANQRQLIALLGETGESFLRALADTDRPVSRQTHELLELVRCYGEQAVREAVEAAVNSRAIGAEYIANLLKQRSSPRTLQPPVTLRDANLNRITTDPLSLLEYDLFIKLE